MESVKVPQHLELEDVVAWGLGATDLLCVVIGLFAGWWLYLALPGDLPLRIAAAIPPALVGAVMGIARWDDRGLRAWTLVALAYAVRPRLLVTR